MPLTYADGRPVIEAWHDPAITPALFSGILGQATPEIPRLEPGLLFAQSVHAPSYKTRVDVIAAHSVRPHIDTDFPAWTALVTLTHADGHALCAADHVPSGGRDLGRVPRTKPHESVTVSPGLITLFNGHRLHWLPRVKGKTLFLCASFSFDDPPSREHVRATILTALDGFPNDDAP